MSVTQLYPPTRPDRAVVLTKALLSAAERLDLSGAKLGQVIGVSGATVSRIKDGAARIEEGTKAFELGALFLRLFRSLDAILNGDEAAMRAWLRTQNTALDAVPLDQITTITGLTRVVGYLDARRARV